MANLEEMNIDNKVVRIVQRLARRPVVGDCHPSSHFALSYDRGSTTRAVGAEFGKVGDEAQGAGLDESHSVRKQRCVGSFVGLKSGAKGDLILYRGQQANWVLRYNSLSLVGIAVSFTEEGLRRATILDKSLLFVRSASIAAILVGLHQVHLNILGRSSQKIHRSPGMKADEMIAHDDQTLGSLM